MERNDFNKDMDRYRDGNFDRAYDRNFRRGNERDSERESWKSGDMRQNDFGTRNYRDDNFRNTRWGSDNSERRERGPHFGKGPKGWKRSDDRIREEACEMLYRDSEIDASDIDIKVKDGTLTMSGTVDGRDMKRAAERCVENLSGVEDVHNELRIKRERGNISDMSKRSEQDQGRNALS